MMLIEDPGFSITLLSSAPFIKLPIMTAQEIGPLALIKHDCIITKSISVSWSPRPARSSQLSDGSLSSMIDLVIANLCSRLKSI